MTKHHTLSISNNNKDHPSFSNIKVNLLTFTLCLFVTLFLILIKPNNELITTKFFFIIFTVLLAFAISIKTNSFRINSHRLFLLGLIWFVWLPNFDFLFGFKIVPYVPLIPSRIDILSSSDDYSLGFILQCYGAILFLYILIIFFFGSKVNLISRKIQFNQINSVMRNRLLFYSSAIIGLFYLFLVFYNIGQGGTTDHWSEHQRFGGGALGYILANLELTILTIVLVLVLYVSTANDYRKLTYILVYSCLAITLVALFIENSRIMLLSFLVSLAAVYERSGKRISFVHLFLAILFGFAFMVFVSLRRSFPGLDFIALISNVSVYSDAGLGLVNVARKELEFYPAMGYWLELIDTGKFWNFEYSVFEYIRNMFFFWIPGPLFDENGPITAQIGFLVSGDPSFSANISALGESMLIFGYAAIPLLALFFAITVIILDRKLANWNSGVAFVIFASILVQILRGPFVYFVAQIIILSLFWGFIILFNRTFAIKKFLSKRFNWVINDQ